MDWLGGIEDRDRWPFFVNTGVDFRVPCKVSDLSNMSGWHLHKDCSSEARHVTVVVIETVIFTRSVTLRQAT
jgi:hypothetical protein